MRSRHALFLSLLAAVCLITACATNPQRPGEESTDKQVESHYLLGLDALEKNNLPKAFEELLHAEKLDPNRADVLDALGYAWRLRGDFDKSQAYYTRALSITPAARTWNNYGTLLLAMHKPKEAEAAFRKALDDPSYPHPDYAYINLGDALLMQNRLGDAIAAYREARLLNPQEDLSRLKEAAAYSSHGHPTFAIAMYETILRDSPANREALAGLIPLLEKQGNFNEARQQLNNFIKVTSEPMDKAWAEERLKSMQP
jgi:type IV pilus biogenesis/stability protein PilW